jgi:RNA polymerase sigma-70 factor, ECF subfamily
VTGEKRAQLKVSDAMLVARIVQRDESALAALYDRYAGMLSSVLNRILRDTQAAEEILQDIFYQLWRNASQFDPQRGSLPGWLLVIARNRAISRLRRHNPASGDELLENTVIVPGNLESVVAQQQLLGKVKSAVENLPKEQRATLELAYYEGLTHSEIAARTGDPLGTVKTRLRTAVETLKRNLQI